MESWMRNVEDIERNVPSEGMPSEKEVDLPF
jgi:hypothetical protein